MVMTRSQTAATNTSSLSLACSSSNQYRSSLHPTRRAADATSHTVSSSGTTAVMPDGQLRVYSLATLSDWATLSERLLHEVASGEKHSFGFNIDCVASYHQKGRLWVMRYADSDNIIGWYALMPCKYPTAGQMIIFIQAFVQDRGDGTAMLCHIEEEIIRNGGNKVEVEIVPGKPSFWEDRGFMFEGNSQAIMGKQLHSKARSRKRGRSFVELDEHNNEMFV